MMKLFEECPIGIKVYGVHERYYLENGKHKSEFIVTEEKVVDHYQYKYKEIRTSDGKTPRYYQAKDFGKSIFFTGKEAAQEALKRTIKNDQKWTRYGEQPMRRTWEKYLDEKS